MLKRVRCWSGGGPQNEVWNWGDAISPALFQHIVGEAPEIVDYKELNAGPHLMICGSTLKWATETSVIWGIGEIRDGVQFVKGANTRPLRVAAVRGPLTRDRLMKIGVSCPDVYGDPALLFPRFYQPEISPTFELGIVPHYIDQDASELSGFSQMPGVKIIDITQRERPDKIHGFIDDVLSCKRIVSSSLHGLILAEAYGRPAVWAELSDKVFGGGYKFRDYFLSLGRNPDVHSPLRGLGDPDDLIKHIDAEFDRHGPIKFDSERLLAAFPRD